MIVTATTTTVTITNGYFDTSFSVAKDGYKAIALGGYTIGSTYWMPFKCWINIHTQIAYIGARYFDGSVISGELNISFYVVYIKA